MSHKHTQSLLVLLAVVVTAGAAQGVVRWPMGNGTTPQKVWTTYGQYEGYYHEGLDMIVTDGSEPDVNAAEAGKVVEVYSPAGTDPDYHFLTVQRTGNAKQALHYVHVKIGVNGGTGDKWKVGDAVAQGNKLGVVADQSVVHDHLHFAWLNDSESGWHPGGYPIPDHQGDPLDILDPNTDDVKPSIVKEKDPHYREKAHFLYRKGDHERMAGAKYWKKEMDGRVVITDNIDIVVRAYDRFRTFGGTNYDIGLKKIQFSVGGPATIATQVLEEFSELFLTADAPVGRNNFEEHRDKKRGHVVYEKDNTAKGKANAIDGTADGKFYHIVTNKDDDDNNELTDRDRYWDTDGKKGEAWNDIDETAGHEAANNGNDAAFPDGFYAVTVKAFSQGQASPVPAPVDSASTDSVYVNNWSQTIIPNKTKYTPGEMVFVTGANYRESTQYTIYLIKKDTWPDHAPIPHGAVVATVMATSDAMGNIPNTLLWGAYVPNGMPDRGYDIVVDYDFDGQYHLPRNGFTIDALSHIISNPQQDPPGIPIPTPDCMQTTATMVVELWPPLVPDTTEYTISFDGATLVHRGESSDPGDGHLEMMTEMAGMNLVGFHPGIGPVRVIESPNESSGGVIKALQPGPQFPAFSDFGIHAEIITPAGILFSPEPKLMTAVIEAVPPIDSTYTGPDPTPLKMLGVPELGTVGVILSVFHTPIVPRQWMPYGLPVPGVEGHYTEPLGAQFEGVHNQPFQLVFAHQDGPGQVDPFTGVWNWHPQGLCEEIGEFRVVVHVTDEFDPEFQRGTSSVLAVTRTNAGPQIDTPSDGPKGADIMTRAPLQSTVELVTPVEDDDGDPLTVTVVESERDGVPATPTSDPVVDGDGNFSWFTADDAGVWRFALEVSDGCATDTGDLFVQVLTAPVGVEVPALPRTFDLAQNAPNPFRGRTVIRYDLPRASEVDIAVYNVRGQKVSTLVQGMQSAGSKTVRWDGRDDSGRRVAAGAYFLVMRAEDFHAKKEMILLR